MNSFNADEAIEYDPNVKIPEHFLTLKQNNTGKDPSVLISSDSDFDLAEFEAGHRMQINKLAEQKKKAREAKKFGGLNKSWFENVDGDGPDDLQQI